MIRVSIVILLLFVLGCATSSRKQTNATSNQQMIAAQQSDEQLTARIHAESVNLRARWQQAQNLPLQQRIPVEEQLLRESQRVERSLDQVIQAGQRQQTTGAQNELTQTINDLSNQLRQTRGAY
jgi:hypothetical protein